MLAAVWAFIPTTVKWALLVALISAVGIFAWKVEHNAKLRAEAAKASAELGMRVGYEGYVKLYQEREAIKDKAASQRRKLNELQQANDLGGLRDSFNNPDGVLRPLHSNPAGSIKAPATYHDPAAPGAQYQEAP